MAASKASLVVPAKTASSWNRAFATIRAGAAKLAVSLRGLWTAFKPAIIISAIIAAVGYFKNIYDEARRIKNIFKEYKKEAESVGNTQEVKMLQTQLAIMNSKTRSQKEINAAQAILQKMLGKEKLSQEEINKRIAKRIELLKAAAEADFYAKKAVEKEDVIRTRATRLGIKPEELTSLAKLKGDNKLDDYFAELNKVSGITSKNVTFSQVRFRKSIIDVMDETVEDLKVLADADKYLVDTTVKANTLTSTMVDPADLKKQQEALRKLNQLKKELALEAERGELDFRQSELDLEADSFDKKLKQLQLNHDKELFEIKKFQHDKEKAQEDAAKQIYEAKHGNTDGFYNYYDKLSDKDKNALLPIELRPTNIAEDVERQMKVAEDVFRNGGKAIQVEIGAMQAEERLRFASNLDKQLSDTRKYYEDRIRYAQGDADLVATLEANREKEIQDIVLQSINRQLEFELGFNQQLQQLQNDRKFFETDKRKALLEQELKDQQAIFNNQEKQVLNDPKNEELVRQLKAAYMQLKLINKELGQTKFDKLRELASNTAEIFGSIRSSLDDFGVELGENANKTLDGVVKTFDSLASIDMNNPISAINGAIGALGGLGKVFGGIFGGANYKEYDQLKAKYDTLLDIWDQLLEKKKTYLSASTAVEVTRTEKEALQLIDKQSDAVRKLGEARLNAGKSSVSHSQWYRMWKGSYKFDGKNWQNVAGEISKELNVKFTGMSDMLYMTSDQLQYIKENYSGLWSTMDGEFRNYLEQLIQYGDEAIEIAKAAKEALTGISFDGLKDSFLNNLADMDSSAKDFSEDFEEYLRKAILKAMMEKTYAKQLEAWYDSFADANRDGNIDTNEYTKLQNEWNDIVNGALAERDKLKDLFNWSTDNDTSQNSSKGYSTSMDQDTGGAILGRLTGVHESILTMISMISNVNLESSKVLTNTISIGDELKKHTAIFYEMQQMQVKSYRQGEKISENVSSLLEIKNDLSAINKNTKGLAPR